MRGTLMVSSPNMKVARVTKLLTVAVACGLLLSGCAATRHPSAAGQQAVNQAAAVRTDMEAAKSHMQNVSEAVKAAGGDNSEIKNMVERMEAKTIVIDRWLETQPAASPLSPK